MEYITLNNGVKMPKAGFGVYQVNKEECERVFERIVFWCFSLRAKIKACNRK